MDRIYLPRPFFRDHGDWDIRARRLLSCALDRSASSDWIPQIERAELWADGGVRPHNSQGSRLACMPTGAGAAEPPAGIPFRTFWQALADIVGPRDLPPLPPGWTQHQYGLIPSTAEAIYQDRAWDQCPILADALEDAGCEACELLSHLRKPGPHHRGCWALDYLTGQLIWPWRGGQTRKPATGRTDLGEASSRSRPRRRHLVRLPETDRPVRWEVLAWEVIPSGAPLSDVRAATSRFLATDGPIPVLRQGDQPEVAYRQRVPHVWHDDLVVTIHVPERGPDAEGGSTRPDSGRILVVEREVVVG